MSKWNLAVLVPLLFCLGQRVAYAGAVPPDPLAVLMKHLARYPVEMQSVWIRFTSTRQLTANYYRLENDNPRTDPPVRSKEVVWAWSGKRIFDQSQYISPTYGASGNPITRNIYDGERQFNISTGIGIAGHKPPHQDDVMVKRADDHNNLANGEINPLDFGYMSDGEWLVQLLKSGAISYAGTENDKRFGPVWVIDWTSPNHQTIKRFWFAVRYGFLAVRERCYHTEVQGLTIFRCLKLVRYGNLWIPSEARFIWGTAGSPTSAKTILLVRNISLTQFRLNRVPASLFQVKLPAGSVVYDEDTHAKYRVGVSGQWIRIVSLEAPKPPPLPSILAGWLFITTTMILLIIGMNVLIRWRRQRKSL